MPEKVIVCKCKKNSSIERFRIEEDIKTEFQKKCSEAGIDITNGIRSLIRAVNSGKIILAKDGD